MKDAPSEVAPSGAPRKRHRVARWVLRVLLGLVVLLVVVRVWWGYSAGARLQAIVDDIRSRGEPLAWKDFATPPIPDEDNAVELYKQAAYRPLLGGWFDEEDRSPKEKQRAYELGLLLDDLVARPAPRRKHAEKVREILAIAAGPLALCRQARSRTGVDWKTDYERPAIGSRPALARLNRLCQVLCLAGLAAHDAGDDAAALERFRDALALARAPGRYPVLVAAVMCWGLEGYVFLAIEQAAPRLAIGGQRGAARAEDVRRLVAELLDESLVGQGWVRAMMGERSFLYDTMERVRRGEMSLDEIGLGQSPERGSTLKRLGLWLFPDPFYADQEAALLRHGSGHVAAARAASYPRALAEIPALPSLDSSWQRTRNLLVAILLPDVRLVCELHYRMLVMRRGAATALAIRLYEKDHGRRPDKLTDLVPKYLPTVPADPFTKGGQAIRYCPKADPPLLYSVSRDGKDDGGRFAVNSWGRVDGGKSADGVFFLDGNRPAIEPEEGLFDEPTPDSPTTTQPVEKSEVGT